MGGRAQPGGGLPGGGGGLLGGGGGMGRHQPVRGKMPLPGGGIAGGGGGRAGGGAAKAGRDVRASTGQLDMEVIGTKPHRLHF